MCQVKKLVNVRLEDRGASPPPTPKNPKKTKQNKTKLGELLFTIMLKQ